MHQRCLLYFLLAKSMTGGQLYNQRKENTALNWVIPSLCFVKSIQTVLKYHPLIVKTNISSRKDCVAI